MRKLISFISMLLLTFILGSCSTDDSSSDQDIIVGKWRKTKVVENGIELAQDCSYQGILQYKSDGSFTNETYSAEQNGDCTLFGTGSGTWMSNGNGSYTTIVSGDSSNVQFIFENNDIFTYTFESNGFEAVLTYQRQ